MSAAKSQPAQLVDPGYLKVCLAILDLDYFTKLNDSYGHPFGDQVLQAVGESLSASVRPVDVACRYGGEEFAAILDETSLPAGLAAVERMRESLARLDLRPRGERVPIRASIGIACTDQFTVSATLNMAALVSAADRALYAAKHAGRDRVCLAESSPASTPASQSGSACQEPPRSLARRPCPPTAMERSLTTAAQNEPDPTEVERSLAVCIGAKG